MMACDKSGFMGESQVYLGLLTTSAVLTLFLLKNFRSNPYSKISYVTSDCIEQLYIEGLIIALKSKNYIAA